MIDTTQIREAVQDKNYRNVWLDGSTHYEGCEYKHYPCAVLKLCDEADALRADLIIACADAESERKWVEEYHKAAQAAVAEVERLKGIIHKVEWVSLTDGDGNFAYQECSECGYSREHGHHQDCPFRGWEGGE